MEVLKKLRDRVEKNLESLAEKENMTPGELETATKAVCLIKDIDKVMHGDYETSEGMREMMYPHKKYSYGWYDPHVHDGYSEMRGRDAATGRYVSREGDSDHDIDHSGRRMRGMSYGRYYDHGYSGHSIDDRIIDKLEHMMDEAQSDYERHKLNQIIRVVESMKGE